MTADEKSSVRLCSMALVVVALTGVFLVEQVIQPSYWIKTAIKVAAFSVPVILYSFWSDKGILESINLRKISRPAPLILCMLLFFTGVMLLFFVFHNQLDLAGIKQSLMQKENLTKSNCFFVSWSIGVSSVKPSASATALNMLRFHSPVGLKKGKAP